MTVLSSSESPERGEQAAAGGPGPARWVAAACALCGDRAADTLFTFPDVAAPGGTATIVRCRRCGLRRLDPRPGPAVLAELYGDGYYTRRGRRRGRLKQAVWDRLRDAAATDVERTLGAELLAAVAAPVARRAFDINVPIAAPRPRVLDIGCGFGDLLIHLEHHGCEVLGVEADARAAEVGAAYGVPIVVGDLGALSLEPSSFDVAVMSHSLEHLGEPLATLRHVARALVPGGALHLAVPNGDAPGLEVQREKWGALCYPVHFWYFDPFTLSALLARAGFAVTWSNSADIVNHHVRFWRRRLSLEPLGAGRDLLRALSRRLRTPPGGDVLRVVARKIPPVDGAPASPPAAGRDASGP